jgi:NAD(P)-dependent dehydrogenase (short-subunit alcohol dehydrogenase family)
VVGTNYFGPFRLTRALLPAFSRGDARIVGLSSSIYPLGRFKSAKLDSYRWVKAYAVSKYAMLLFMLALAERLAPLGISANAVDPGVVRTSIMFSGLWTDTLVDLLCRPFYVSPEEGAAEVVRLAAAPEARGLTGGFWRRGRAVALPAGYADPALVRESFAATERLLGSFYPVP